MPEAPEFFHSGTVISVNTKTMTCDILKTEGGYLYKVPIANTTGGIFTNDVSFGANLRGAIVYYTYIDGSPYIMGTIPSRVEIPSKISTNVTETETGGANTQTYGAATSGSFAGGRETDFQPNDKILASDGDSKIALLSEGGVAIKASPLSQIIMGAGMDFIKMVCREFSIFSDFGELAFTHGSSGRTGLTIKGGAAYSDEAQAGTGTNTVFMQLGDTEDAPETRFGVRVTSTDGGDFGALTLGKDGKLLFTTSKDYLLMVAKDKHTLVDGDVFSQTKGNCSVEVQKNQKTNIFQNEERTVGQKRTTIVGAEENKDVASDMNLQVGGTLTVGCNGLILTSYGGGGGQHCDIQCSSFSIVRA